MNLLIACTRNDSLTHYYSFEIENKKIEKQEIKQEKEQKRDEAYKAVLEIKQQREQKKQEQVKP